MNYFLLEEELKNSLDGIIKEGKVSWGTGQDNRERLPPKS